MKAFEILSLIGAFSWISILILPWRPWSTRETLDPEPSFGDIDLSQITVLTPARDEAEVIGKTATGIESQGGNLRWVLVDDQSADGTAEIARKNFQGDLKIVCGLPLQEGWAGKLWALEQGRQKIETPFILLLDADIFLEAGIVGALKKKIDEENLDFVSLMANLRMQTFWEKLLIPSFIYFFKLLYPFSLANSSKSKQAAAAGGCILLRRSALEKIGGFSALRGALIDDCTLAKKIKDAGFKIWIGLTHSVVSHRDYPDLKSIWNMVARSAFTQLKYSKFILLGCTTIMTAMFLLPLPGSFFASEAWIRAVCFAGFISMIFSYRPTLTYYRRSPTWAFLMPLVGLLYLAMTWTSAIRYWFGKKSEWKGRVYSTKEAA